MSVSPFAKPACAHCHQPDAPHLCQGCVNIGYCNEACQSAHWNEHAGQCATMQHPLLSYQTHAVNARAHAVVKQMARIKVSAKAPQPQDVDAILSDIIDGL